MIWITSFEGTPGGSDFGNITAKSLRDMKSLFRTLISKEHTFDETEIVNMTHRVGYCSVVGVDIENVSSIIENGVGIVNGDFIHYDGINTVSIGANNHSDLLNLNSGNPHPQYVLSTDPEFINVEIDDILNVGSISYPSTLDDNFIFARNSHITNDISYGVRHGDAILDNSDLTASFESTPSKIALEKELISAFVTEATVSNNGLVRGSFNCHYIDTNYQVYVNPSLKNTSGAFTIFSATEGDIYTKNIEESGE